MQKNEIDESAKGNISNKKDCILKKEVFPTKEVDPKA